MRSFGLLIFFLIGLQSNTVFAQSASQVYLLAWDSQSEHNLMNINKVQYLSGFNKSGYNNQPYFDNNALYLTTSSDNGSMDIITLATDRKTFKKITDTPLHSEFSPTIFQGDLYFVRQSLENKYQELWKKGQTETKAVTHHTNVAYYRILNAEEIALVLIEDNALNLYLYNTNSKSEKLISKSVGRSLEVDAEDNLYFIHKYNDKDWYIKKYNLSTQRSSIIQKTLPEVEDFYLDREEQNIWMAKASFIYYSNLADLETRWKSSLDLSKYSLNNIKRITKNNKNQMVIINQ